MMPSVTIRCGSSWKQALSAQIEGFDRTWTAGLRHELSAILKPQSRLHAPVLDDPLVAVPLGTLSFVVVLIGLDQLLYHAHKLTEALRIVASVLAGVLVAGLIGGAALASAQFELLMPGAPPRYQKWRRRLLAATLAILVGVIAAAIWAGISA